MNLLRCLVVCAHALRSISLGAAAALVVSPLPSASAETVLNQWNFNGTTAATYRTPWSGAVSSGTIAGFGTSSTPSAPLSSQLINGAVSDPGTVITNATAPVGTWTYNRSVSVPAPLLNVSNTSTGVTFLSPTTGYAGQNIKLSWSQAVGFRASRYYQLLVSTSGTAGPFSVPSGGTGSSISQFVTGLNSGTSTISGTATVSVSSSGLIDFRTIEGNWLNFATGTAGTPANFAAGFVDNISYTLPTGQGYENNANFAFAISTAWDPNGTYTSGTTGLLSSYAGTNSTDLTSGYVTAPGSGGSTRLDLVTVTAVPEPSTYCMALAGLACGGYSMWRRRKRQHRSSSSIIAASLAIAAVVVCASSARADITYQMVTVADVGNAADTTGYGAVNYQYTIGKYAVTIGNYTSFLNSVAASDPYGLYNTNMGGEMITRSGTSGAYSYSASTSKGSATNRPVGYVSWFDAARFANWMTNGQPTGPQGAGTTETGGYTLNGAVTGTAPGRNTATAYFVPSENEWYKAAFFSPVKGGTGGYYLYATQSDSAPGNVVGSSPNQANYYNGVFSTTQSGSFNLGSQYHTDVGAFTNSASYYGTFDQSGNSYQWNDLDGAANVDRGIRGGYWKSGWPGPPVAIPATELTSAVRYQGVADFNQASAYTFGLVQVAAVPEPATYAMALAGIACGGFSMWRRRKRG